jgi:hypothetical protein
LKFSRIYEMFVLHCLTQANCSLVRECVLASIRSITKVRLSVESSASGHNMMFGAMFQAPNDAEDDVPAHGPFMGMTTAALWLLFSYALYSMMGVTVTMIPFDALGKFICSMTPYTSHTSPCVRRSPGYCAK